jgi:hypothetical protein
VLLDNEANSVLLLDGVPQQVTRLAMSHKALAWTPSGYMAVFNATLTTGQTAIIRATIDDGTRLRLTISRSTKTSATTARPV